MTSFIQCQVPQSAPYKMTSIYLRVDRSCITPLFMGAEGCEKSESLQTFFRNFPHIRSLWEQKSCEKSLETFTFDNNRAIWSKSLQKFCVANVAEESCTAEKIPVRGSAKSRTVLEGHTTYTVCRTQSHGRAPHDAHHTKYGRPWITR